MKALVVIDVQQGMFSFPGHPPCDGEAVVQRIAALIDKARVSDTRIFFVQHHATQPGDVLVPGTPGFPFRPEIAPRENDDVTVKTNCNSFQGTDLDAKLKKADVDHLIVCGMQSEFCVDTAVRAAFERGYKITLVSDGHSTFDTKTLKGADIIAHHNATLGGGFATLKKADEVVF